MKRISKAKIIKFINETSNYLLTHNANTQMAEMGAQAQLESCEEEYNELKDKYETRGELLAGQKEAHLAVVREIFRTYDKYIKALEEENGDVIGLAYSHGWRSSQVEFGKKCRSKIKVLKQKYEVK